ncbi:DUF3122 domain-containing protein [Phormidium tenue FACHB-886]|nr:DUF3122 domain-containing protein [Phormidium tenue FACHB-886]
MNRSFFNHFLTLAFILLSFLAALTFICQAAFAAVLYTADTSGSVIIQSRRTLHDQDHHSWQAIAFKPIQPDGKIGELSLRLIGFPGTVEIAHPRSITLTNPQGQSILVPSAPSPSFSNQPHVGQYNLQAILSQLSTDYRLQLELPSHPSTRLQIPPALLQEWQTIANLQPSDLIHACQKFPLEAQHNPAFPTWIGCSD